MRRVDDGAINLRRDLLRRTQIVVHADLDVVRMQIGDLVDHIQGRNHRTADEDPRVVERRGFLGVAHAEGRGLFTAEAEGRGDAIAGEDTELGKHLLLGRSRVLAFHIGDVRVRIDEAGGNGLALQLDDARATGWLHFVRGPYRHDLPALHDQGAVFDDRARAV